MEGWVPQALRETVMLDRRQRKWGRPQETSGNWQEGAWGPVGREKEGARYCREVPGEGPAMPGTQRGTACELRSDHRSLRAAEGRNGRGKPRRLQVRRSACPRQRQGQHHPESSESRGVWEVGARRALVSGAVPPHVQVSDPRRGYGPRARLHQPGAPAGNLQDPAQRGREGQGAWHTCGGSGGRPRCERQCWHGKELGRLARGVGGWLGTLVAAAAGVGARLARGEVFGSHAGRV